jgi:hypothetical protein
MGIYPVLSCFYLYMSLFKMVYSYKNVPHKPEMSFTLTPLSVKVESTDAAFSIPFASISRVKLGKTGGVYSCTLISEQHNVVIRSTSYSEGTFVNQARAYTTFLRVLHYHLREKSKAEFVAGMGSRQMVSLALVFLTSALSIFFMLNLLPYRVEPVLAGILGSLFITGIFLWVNKYQFPKPYSPASIPSNMLPEEEEVVLKEELI